MAGGRAESAFEFVERIDALWQLRLFGQHHGDAIANGITQSAYFGNEKIAFLRQATARDRTAEDIQKFSMP